jgi:pimeloyl-ACP methyl ester carboxylesterase
MKEQLIMIPGTLCDDSLFDHQVQALEDLANCTIGDHSSSDDLKKVAANILEHAEGQFSVMGLSYGGIIAFEMWRQAGGRIKKLILLNTTFKLPSKETKLNQQRFIGMACTGEFKEITSDILKDAMLHPDHAANPVIRKKVLNMALNIGKEKFINQVKSQLGRPDSTADLPFIKCPTLIITGREDKTCTPELHTEMAAMIPGSTLEIIEHCGHLSTIEQPGKLNAIIRKWWLSNMQPAA